MIPATGSALGTAHPSLRDAVRDELRSRMLDGSLPPGTRLVERQLAEDLAVSRIPIREALRDLAAEGFLDERPRRGMVVRRLSDDDVEDLFDIREALEVLVCRRAAQRLDHTGRHALSDALERARVALEDGDRAAAVEANAAFHTALLQAARSRTIHNLLEPVTHRLNWLLRQHPEPHVLYHEHRQLYHAISDGDADRSAQLAAEHLRTSRRQYEASISAQRAERGHVTNSQ